MRHAGFTDFFESGSEATTPSALLLQEWLDWYSAIAEELKEGRSNKLFEELMTKGDRQVHLCRLISGRYASSPVHLCLIVLGMFFLTALSSSSPITAFLIALPVAYLLSPSFVSCAIIVSTIAPAAYAIVWSRRTPSETGQPVFTEALLLPLVLILVMASFSFGILSFKVAVLLCCAFVVLALVLAVFSLVRYHSAAVYIFLVVALSLLIASVFGMAWSLTGQTPSIFVRCFGDSECANLIRVRHYARRGAMVFSERSVETMRERAIRAGEAFVAERAREPLDAHTLDEPPLPESLFSFSFPSPLDMARRFLPSSVDSWLGAVARSFLCSVAAISVFKAAAAQAAKVASSKPDAAVLPQGFLSFVVYTPEVITTVSLVLFSVLIDTIGLRFELASFSTVSLVASLIGASFLVPYVSSMRANNGVTSSRDVTGDTIRTMRQGFGVLSVPPIVVSVLGLFVRDWTGLDGFAVAVMLVALQWCSIDARYRIPILAILGWVTGSLPIFAYALSMYALGVVPHSSYCPPMYQLTRPSDDSVASIDPG